MPSPNPQPSRTDRPVMPGTYGLQPPEGGSGLMKWDRAREQLRQAHNYWVATTRPDGRPHVMPVWGLWFDDAFWFSTDRRSRKARNLSQNAHVAVHLESGDDAVIVEGVVEEVTNPARLAQFVEAYAAKYDVRPDPNDPQNVYYAVRPQTAFAWFEKDFPNGATRWQF